MSNMLNDLHDICETLGAELSKVNSKLKAGNGTLSPSDLDLVDKLTHAIKSVETTKAMLEGTKSGYGKNNDAGDYATGGWQSHLSHSNPGNYGSDEKYRLEDIARTTRDPRIRSEIEQLLYRM